MKKINVEAEVVILMPIKVKVEMLIRADEDVNVNTAIKRYLNGRGYTKADVESADVTHIIDIGGDSIHPDEDVDDVLSQALNKHISEQGEGMTLRSFRVTDSR